MAIAMTTEPNQGGTPGARAIRRILAASDLSAGSERAVARAFALARGQGAELRILHVVDADLAPDVRAHASGWARDMLGRVAARLGEATGVRAAVEVHEGRPRAVLADHADPGRTDLVVLGRGRGRGPWPFAETTAGKVLRSTLPPVLLVCTDAAEPYRRAVIGVDFTMFSRAALRQAAQVAPEATLHLVHAFHVPFKGRIGSHLGGDVAYEQRLRLDEFLGAEMEALARGARDFLGGGREPVRVLREGDPRKVLRAECERIGADLLTIATHGRTVLSRALWGSVASDLLDEPPCDVLVIRPY